MNWRGGSWPVLLSLVAAFLLLFCRQRGRSEFLQIERQRPAARALAERFDLPLADVFALRDLVGVDQPSESWAQKVAQFAALVARGSHQQAVLLATGDELQARRFLLLRERFAQRSAARH